MTGVAAAAPVAGLSLPRGLAAAWLCGFGCMAAELTAVRLLAPHFGDSAYVWTNVIGIILAALAAGAWLGGRFAARADAAAGPARLLFAAGLWLGLAPYATRALAEWLLPAGLPLDAAMPALVRGSFVATAVVFGPPMLLLGAVSPLLVTLVVRASVAVGRAAGAIGAAGTLGSLVGTFTATHWLVPTFGCRAAAGIAAALLCAAAACTLRGRAPAGRAAVVLLVSGLLPFGHTGPLRPAPPGVELLAERESRVQFLQVQRTHPEAAPPRTQLVVNEGLDSFHSLFVAGSALTAGAYYDWHALAPLLAGDGAPPADLRALSIGDAAGSLRAVYAGVFPGARVDGVDIDPACRELGDRWFAAAKAPGDAFVVDGRVFLARTDRRWHVIHVDAYAHQVYVPAHLASREFFAHAHDRLLPGGVLACNIGALRRDDPVLRAIAATVAAVFGHASVLLLPASRNALLVARRDRAPEPARLRAYGADGTALSADDLAAWRGIVTAAARPDAWFDAAAGGPVLVDDRPVLDRLLSDSYLRRDDPGLALAIGGTLDEAAAELQAYTAAQARRWDEVLAAVAQSRAPTAYLRELAGDARWSLRQLASALREYEAAQPLAPDAAAAARLAGKLAAARDEAAPIAAAERAASRLGWLQLAAVGVLAVLAIGIGRRVAPAAPG
ncbi:MAG: fused MFS/spermidine synthase [Planctomycetes bacterium]|nr:fused MFS/spermidine synthase [Planctomycetota bacterium]